MRIKCGNTIYEAWKVCPWKCSLDERDFPYEQDRFVLKKSLEQNLGHTCNIDEAEYFLEFFIDSNRDEGEERQEVILVCSTLDAIKEAMDQVLKEGYIDLDSPIKVTMGEFLLSTIISYINTYSNRGAYI